MLTLIIRIFGITLNTDTRYVGIKSEELLVNFYSNKIQQHIHEETIMAWHTIFLFLYITLSAIR